MIALHTDYVVAAPNNLYHSWLLVALVVNLALILYLVTTVNVGRARGRYKVQPPTTSGHPDFERYYRVQMNTLEQLIVFIPSLLMFAGLWESPKLAAGIGFVWLIGRILYMRGYYLAASKRAVGFVISMLCTVLLTVGAFIGIVKAFL